MKIDGFTRLMLPVIALFLGMIALRPWFVPQNAQAREPVRTTYSDSVNGYGIFVEPGTTTLHAPDGSRHIIGKVVVDLKTGNIWGFPTSSDLPYPMDNGRNTGATSHPIYLGKYDLAAMDRMR